MWAHMVALRRTTLAFHLHVYLRYLVNSGNNFLDSSQRLESTVTFQPPLFPAAVGGNHVDP